MFVPDRMMAAPAKIGVLGVPIDLGQNRRGVDMGPSAIRAAGLGEKLRRLGLDVRDDGDVAVGMPETRESGDSRARYLSEIAAVCDEVAGRVRTLVEDGRIPLTLGGDHSLAVGTIAGSAGVHADRGEKLGLVWLDAHADMNTPATSPSGNVHGMPLAYALGLGEGALARATRDGPLIPPRAVVLLGLRSVDAGERERLGSAGVHAVTMREIDEIGIRAAMDRAISIATAGTAGFHVSLDMDFVDPRDAPGVGTPVRGGATYREAHLAMELFADSGKMRSLDVVEVNPILDSGNQTADLAVELVLSAFGKRIV